MGISHSKRGLGAGQWLLEKLIQDARDRHDHEMVLEVIEQNEYAVRLYRRCGFQTVRRLIGLVCQHTGETHPWPLEEIDLREAGQLISQYGLADLPWQLAGETIAHLTPPARAYRNGNTYMITSDPEAEHVVIWSLLVEPAARGNHLGLDMLRNVMSNYPGKTWHVPAIFPEELGKVFEMAGFEREDISQWQMRLVL
jgi:ribosomal protein S18 acetylase RimI-like enzyme